MKKEITKRNKTNKKKRVKERKKLKRLGASCLNCLVGRKEREKEGLTKGIVTKRHNKNTEQNSVRHVKKKKKQSEEKLL